MTTPIGTPVSTPGERTPLDPLLMRNTESKQANFNSSPPRQIRQETTNECSELDACIVGLCLAGLFCSAGGYHH